MFCLLFASMIKRYYVATWHIVILMIDIIAIVVVLGVVVVLLWLIQPYKNWKMNFDARQYQPISITTQTRQKYNLEGYQQSVQ